MSTYRDMSSGDLLIPRSKFLSKTVLGGDAELLEDRTGIFGEAFERILDLHKPKHKIALFSLCTSDRPYSSSDKWSKYVEGFSDCCDLIVFSNGGVIPLPFEHQFPFKTYDAKAVPSKTVAKCYREVVGGRIKTFLQAHHYDYVLFVVLMKNRLRPALNDLCASLKEEGNIQDFAVLPDKKWMER